jgi:hypothetical protein
MRDFLRSGPQKTAVAALGALAVLASFIYLGFHKHKQIKDQAWFYNLKTKQLFPASGRSVPPIDTESGPDTGVRAYVYSCADNPNSTQRVIAFLEKVNPDAKRQIEAYLKEGGERAPLSSALERAGSEVLVSSPEHEEWFPRNSNEGLQIIKMGRQKVGCDHLKLCIP